MALFKRRDWNWRAGLRRLGLASLGMTYSMGLSGLGAQSAWADVYPVKPITVIVDNGPGSAQDIWIRRVSGHLSEVLGQPVVIENKPGASGTMAADAVVRAKPDGYTLLYAAANPVVTYPMAGGAVRYNPEKDFVPTAVGTTGGPALLAGPQLGLVNLADLLALAKKRAATGGDLTCSVTGLASSYHFACAMVGQALGVPIRPIFYKTSPAAFQDAASGQVDLTVGAASETLGLIASKKLQPLAVLTPERWLKLPEVPTFKELGYPDAVMPLFNGAYFPAGTPAAVIQKFNSAFNSAFLKPEIAEALRTVGVAHAPFSPQEFAGFVHIEQQRIKRLSDSLNIKVEN